MPRAPKELMLLAVKTNGLVGDGVKPWHLKARFTVYDKKGIATDQGTFEEFWANQHKYKTTITSTGFSQTTFGTEKGTLFTGDRGSEPALYSHVNGEFAKPFYFDEKQLNNFTVELTEGRDSSGAELLCLLQYMSTVGVIGKAPGEKGSTETLPYRTRGSTYCLEKGIPALRVSTANWEAHRIIHNNIMIFQGRYVPRDLKAILDSKTDFEAHLDTLEELNSLSDADFTPPPDALPPHLQVNVSSEIAQSQLLHHNKPESPPDAMAAHVSGTVILRATIGTDGHIVALHVVSGPAMLQQSALNAVQNWTYKPFLLNKQPVEMNTTINVTFKGH